jgi:hypothetical protein
VVHDVKGIFIRSFGIATVYGKTGSQAVAPLMHIGNGRNDLFARVKLAGSVHHPENRALGDDLLVIVRVVGFRKVFHKILLSILSQI